MYAKITPTNQEFDPITTNPIIIRALAELSDNSFFAISEDNGARFYECVLYVKDDKVFPSTRTDHYKWELVNSLYLQQNLLVLVSAKKLTEPEYVKKGTQFQLRNPIAHNLTIH